MRYSELARDTRAHGYRTTIISIQIVSWGVVEGSHLEDFSKCLKHVPANEWKLFLINDLHRDFTQDMVYEKLSCMKQHFKQVEPFSFSLSFFCCCCSFIILCVYLLLHLYNYIISLPICLFAVYTLLFCCCWVYRLSDRMCRMCGISSEYNVGHWAVEQKGVHTFIEDGISLVDHVFHTWWSMKERVCCLPKHRFSHGK